MGATENRERDYRLFLNGVEIAKGIKEIQIEEADPIEIPESFDEITITVKLNWLQRLKWKITLWKIFHRKR